MLPARNSTFFVLLVLACFPTAGFARTVTEIIFGPNRCYEPYGIAIDDAGNVYVTGVRSNNAFKITPDGVITEIIDRSGDGMGNTLDRPYGIAVDDSGNAYITGVGSDNAFKITPDGAITEIIDSTGDGMGNTLDYPSDIAVDDSGNAYVTGDLSDNALRITPDGVITEIIGSTGDGMGNALDGPRGIAVDDSGNAYVTGSTSTNAFKIMPDGVITEIIDFTGDGMGNTLEWPHGIAVADSGNAYVTGADSDNAFKITPDGVITEIIDSTGDGMGNRLHGPSGIAVDDSGNAYVTGWGTDNAFKITPDGSLDLDIKPGSCPNSVNPRSRGVVPMAIVGAESFEVTEAGLGSVTLARTDGVGSEIAPATKRGEVHASIEDVATPFETTGCDCHDLGGDGIDDLVLKFSTPEMTDAFELDSLERGSSLMLTIRGFLLDGTPFEASDCVRLVGHGKGKERAHQGPKSRVP